MGFAATHRSAFMWPWEEPPHSIASGILDDETTTGWPLRGMQATGGTAVVVDEATLAGPATWPAGGRRAASATGASGLAGVIELQRQG